MIYDTWEATMDKRWVARIYDWIRFHFLNPSEEITGYLEIELKRGKIEKFTLRVDNSKAMREAYINWLDRSSGYGR